MSAARQTTSPRPAVAVVMPFAGTPAQAGAALAALDALQLREGDVVVLADNSGTAPPEDPRVRSAVGERSPAHARNAGVAACAGGGPEWLLFLDADTDPDPDLLDAFFAAPIDDEVGAVAGAVVPAPGASLAARYGAARNFLDTGSHLAHPFRPRVASANLLVRRAAFDAVGGFLEGIRTAEDTDLSWRLQDAGWTLATRPDARVRHAYRPTLRDLRAQWRQYAAGRAWLARRYPAYTPEPALARAARRLLRRGRPPTGAGRRASPSPPDAGLAPLAAAAIDVALGVEELVGLLLANRPSPTEPRRAAATVVVAERLTIEDAVRPGWRVEAGRRGAATTAPIDYREDDGALERALALARLLVTRPGGVLGDRRADGPSLLELAPAAVRLRADPGATVRPSSDAASAAVAARLRTLAGGPSR